MCLFIKNSLIEQFKVVFCNELYVQSIDLFHTRDVADLHIVTYKPS